MKKKIISLIMACTMVVTLIPGPAMASSQENLPAGETIKIEKNTNQNKEQNIHHDINQNEEQNINHDTNQNINNKENQNTNVDALNQDKADTNPNASIDNKTNKDDANKEDINQNPPRKNATRTTTKAPTQTSEKGVFINTKNFDDKYFREYVKHFDENKDGKLSARERSNVKYMNLNGEQIRNLHGIGWFKSLEVLNIAECRNITSYNASKNPNLRELRCWEATNLKTIVISENPKLEKLDVSYSAVEKLDLSKNTRLKNLNCAGCEITKLSLSKNTKLENLDVSDNQLKSLSLKSNPNLINVSCWNNPTLKTINVSACKNLQTLDCSECINLESLNVTSCTKLKKLECWSDYKLKTLNLSKNTQLEYLDCSYNELQDLDLSKNKALTELNCEQCALTALDLSANTKLKEIKAEGNLLRVGLPIVLLDSLSKDFDPAKVSNVKGGVLEEINGSYKDFRFINSETITYDYEIKEGLKEKFTIKTTFNVPHEKPAAVTSLAIYPDYGMIKAVCPVNNQEGATYRFACRESGTKKWHYYNRTTNEIVLKKLKKDVLYDIAVANVLGDDRSAYKQKRIYTNRVGNYPDPMVKNQVEKVTTTKGKISVTAKKITYTTDPKIVKYRFAYKVKGGEKWTYIKTSKNARTIDKLKSGKTYTVAVGHYYVSPLDDKTIVYSPLSKAKNIKVK